MADEKTTEYVILSRQVPAGKPDAELAPPGWHEMKRVNARSATEAIRAQAGNSTACLYVAVPVRSWQPVKVTPKTTVTYELEEVTA